MRYSKLWAQGFLALAASAVLSFSSRSAKADSFAALDIDYATPVKPKGPFCSLCTTNPDIGPGAGATLRFGPKLDLKLLTIAGELGGSYYHLSGPLDPDSFRAFLGARVGLGLIVQPSLFAHLGVGHVNYRSPSSRSPSGDLTNVEGDAGVALDFTLIPKVNLGAQAAYNVIAGNNTTDQFDFYTVGGHLELDF